MRLFPSVFAAAMAIASISHAATMIVVRGAHIRLPPPAAPTAAGYATVTNASRLPNRLLGATSPAAARVEIHEMSMTGGIMRMRAVTEGLAIDPGQTLRLTEGGDHLMLVSPTRPLKAGDRVAITLRFQTGGSVPTIFTVGR